MNLKTIFYSSSVFVLIVAFLLTDLNSGKAFDKKQEESKIRKIEQPYCIQMYDAIMKYSEMYNIPKNYAFGIAYAETRYDGPFDWNYNHMKTSSAGAIGPMQIMPSTGKLMWKDIEFSNQYLKENIDFNVHTSMKLLRKLHDKYKDWKIVFGCYNTGKPLVNGYAISVYNHKINWELN
jgi:soluble lytic murein transglycosylase-like protein